MLWRSPGNNLLFVFMCEKIVRLADDFSYCINDAFLVCCKKIFASVPSPHFLGSVVQRLERNTHNVQKMVRLHPEPKENFSRSPKTLAAGRIFLAFKREKYK